MPAGTGVWVVNTVPARFRSSAVSKFIPWSMNSRIRSRPRKPAWPSLVWNTSGAGAPVMRAVRADGPYAADAEQHLLGEPVVACRRRTAGRSPRARSRRSAPRRSPAAAAAPGRPAPPRPGRTVVRPASGTSIRTGPSSSCSRVSGSALRVEQRVALLLPAGRVQRLAEVALPVEQPDADDRHAEVAGRLQVVAGQDAQAAGVLRQHLGDAELRREVADRPSARPGSRRRSPGTTDRRSGSRRGRPG